MFFAPPFVFPPAGLFSLAHGLLFLLTAVAIGLGLYLTHRADEATLRRIIRGATATLWGLEISKIVFVLQKTGSRNPNDFIPLYYCSLVLYAGALSSLCRGKLRRLGDVFLATGGLIGGLCFLVCPNTSLPRYPLFHFISFHSFLLHGLMVYLGLLLILRGALHLRLRDLWYCAGLVSGMCLAAYIFNTIADRLHGTDTVNLMFMSHDFPGTPIHILYTIAGPLFPAAMWLLQAFIPYLAVYGVLALYRKLSHRTL